MEGQGRPPSQVSERPAEVAPFTNSNITNEPTLDLDYEAVSLDAQSIVRKLHGEQEYWRVQNRVDHPRYLPDEEDSLPLRVVCAIWDIGFALTPVLFLGIGPP